MSEQEFSHSQTERSNEYEFGHGKFVAVRAKPVGETELTSQETPGPIVYLPGHNLNPQKGIEKATFDAQQIANESGSEVISFVFLGGRSNSLRLASGYPEGAKLPQYYVDKASDINKAIRQMREQGDLDKGPLDLIAYSDGGPIALTMVEQYPNGFQHVELVNAVGPDKKSALGTALSVPIEIMRVAGLKAVNAARRLIEGGAKNKDEKLKFDTSKERGRTPWERVKQGGRIGRQLGTEHASVARSRTDTLVANVLKRNPQLHFGIFTTEGDKIVSQKRTEKHVSRAFGTDESRVTFADTAWDQHMIGLQKEKRTSRLQDMGKWMQGMRQATAARKIT